MSTGYQPSGSVVGVLNHSTGNKLNKSSGYPSVYRRSCLTRMDEEVKLFLPVQPAICFGGRFKPVQPKVKRRVRTSAAMVGLVISMGAPNHRLDSDRSS